MAEEASGERRNFSISESLDRIEQAAIRVFA